LRLILLLSVIELEEVVACGLEEHHHHEGDHKDPGAADKCDLPPCQRRRCLDKLLTPGHGGDGTRR
jgi:hypothetical protein